MAGRITWEWRCQVLAASASCSAAHRQTVAYTWEHNAAAAAAALDIAGAAAAAGIAGGTVPTECKNHRLLFAALCSPLARRCWHVVAALRWRCQPWGRAREWEPARKNCRALAPKATHCRALEAAVRDLNMAACFVAVHTLAVAVAWIVAARILPAAEA